MLAGVVMVAVGHLLYAIIHIGTPLISLEMKFVMVHSYNNSKGLLYYKCPFHQDIILRMRLFWVFFSCNEINLLIYQSAYYDLCHSLRGFNTQVMMNLKKS